MNEVDELNQIRLDYAKKLMEYSESQVELWKKVPWLSLQADGRGGFSDSYASCYIHGIWRIRSSVQNGYFSCSVDCDTGKLYRLDKIMNIKDSNIFQLNPEDFNVSEIIENLKNFDPTKDHSIQNNKMDMNWREKEAEKHGLSETYVRVRKIPEPYWGID